MVNGLFSGAKGQIIIMIIMSDSQLLISSNAWLTLGSESETVVCDVDAEDDAK